MFYRKLCFQSLYLAIGFVVLCSASSCPAEDAVDFNRDIRPILSERCFQCHGPDKNTREADLRLDEQAELFAGNRGVRRFGEADIPARPRWPNATAPIWQIDRAAKNSHQTLGARGSRMERPLGLHSARASRGSATAGTATRPSHRCIHSLATHRSKTLTRSGS